MLSNCNNFYCWVCSGKHKRKECSILFVIFVGGNVSWQFLNEVPLYLVEWLKNSLVITDF